MSNTDENTPYLDKIESLLGPLRDPLDEFLHSMKRSPDRLHIVRLFQPLCSNQSVNDHRSQKVQPLNQITVWMDDSNNTRDGRREYNGVMTSAEFLKNLTMKVNYPNLFASQNYQLTRQQRLGHDTLPDACIRRMYELCPSCLQTSY